MSLLSGSQISVVVSDVFEYFISKKVHRSIEPNVMWFIGRFFCAPFDAAT